MNFILSDVKSAGKSSVLLELSETLWKKLCGGFSEKSIWQNNHKKDLYFVNLATGSKRFFGGWPEPGAPFTHEKDATVFAKQALDEGFRANKKILVFDEWGPLEEAGNGIITPDELGSYSRESDPYCHLLVTVRPSMVAGFRERMRTERTISLLDLTSNPLFLL